MISSKLKNLSLIFLSNDKNNHININFDETKFNKIILVCYISLTMYLGLILFV